MPAHNHIVVFIPGLLGTELRYPGDGARIRPRPVWCGDLAVLVDSLTNNTSVLKSPLETGRVLRSVERFGFRKPKPAYGPLLDYLVNDLGYVQNRTLFEFPYDWRQDIRNSAMMLAKFLEIKIAAGAKRIVLIGHSMGGLIARLLLTDMVAPAIIERVALAVVIGAPMLGSAKAFYTLKCGIDIPFIGSIVELLNPGARDRLLDALRNCPSIYGLLPPRDQPILISETGERFSATDPAAWGPLYGGFLADADQVHGIIKACRINCLQAIYSTEVPTPHDFSVDSLFQRIKRREPPVFGDGTVTIASARFSIEKEKCHPINKAVAHDQLPSSQDVHTILRDLLRDVDNLTRTAQAAP